MQVECCVCHEWRDKDDKKRWFTPTPEQRRNHHFLEPSRKTSHTYCPHCYILNMRQSGISEEELIDLVKETQLPSPTA